jgi:hypothetical protein
MNTGIEHQRNRASLGAWAGVVVVAVLGIHLAGCNEVEEKVPPPKVETVTQYGLTLDENATPQQVAYVLLRSLAEDVQAAQAKPPQRDAQKNANMITWSLAAPDEIEKRLLDGRRLLSKKATRPDSLGVDRDKQIYAVVNLWAPIVAYYVSSFDKDPQTAMARMKVRRALELTGDEVLYEVWPDPSRPDKDRHQTLSINLVRQKGTDSAKEYCRVARVGFAPRVARPTTAPSRVLTTQPATRPMKED